MFLCVARLNGRLDIFIRQLISFDNVYWLERVVIRRCYEQLNERGRDEASSSTQNRGIYPCRTFIQVVGTQI